MLLIGSFLALLVIGEGMNVGIALLVERFSEAASLTVFFALLVLVIVTAWHIAVRLTDPGGMRASGR